LSQPLSASVFEPSSTAIQDSSQEINLATAVTKKQSSENPLYSKRGIKMKKPSILMEEAVDVLKQFCTSDPTSSTSSSSASFQSEIVTDTAHTLALFVESRLCSLSLEKRKECENEIMKVLTNY